MVVGVKWGQRGWKVHWKWEYEFIVTSSSEAPINAWLIIDGNWLGHICAVNFGGALVLNR